MGLHVHLPTTSDAAAASTRTVRGIARSGMRAHPCGRESPQLMMTTFNNNPEINFWYTPGPKDQSTKIVFIQVVKLVMDGKDVLPSEFHPSFSFKDADT